MSQNASAIREISTERLNCIVLTGDLSGFSNSFVYGNTVVVEEFIRRFYVVCEVIVSAAEGELVKYTGDGFLAIWPLTSDFKSNSIIARVVCQAALALSGFVRAAELDLKLGLPVCLKQGVAVEAGAIRVSFKRAQGIMEHDYIGRMVNLAFRIPSLAKSFPHITAHKHYIELAAMYEETPEKRLFHRRLVTNAEIRNIFKGVSYETDAILTFELPDELVNAVWGDHGSKILPANPPLFEKMREHFHCEPSLVAFQSRLAEKCMLDPTWLGSTYRRYLEFILSLYTSTFIAELRRFQP